MGEYILMAMVLALAAYGCAELIVRLLERCFRASGCRGVYVLSLKAENAEYSVRTLMSQCRCPVIIIDKGLDEETRCILSTLVEEYPRLHICEPQNFEKIWIDCLQ